MAKSDTIDVPRELLEGLLEAGNIMAMMRAVAKLNAFTELVKLREGWDDWTPPEYLPGDREFIQWVLAGEE